MLEAVPNALAEYCGARSTSLIVWETPTQLERTLSTNYFAPEYWADYEKHFGDKDVWAQNLFNAPPNHAFVLEQYVNHRDFVRGEFYNDLVRKNGDDTAHCLAAWLPLPNGQMLTLGLHRGLTPGQFTPELQQRLQRTLPHFKRLATLWRMLGGATRSPKLTEEILDSLSAGIMVLDGAGSVVYQNHAADEMLKRIDGLGCRLGLLVAAEHDVSIQLQAMIKHIVLNPKAESSGALRISRPSGKRAYNLMLAPLRQQLPSLSGKVLAVLDDPEAPVTQLCEHLENLFGLTPAEAELAAQLAEGRSLDQIAGTKNVAMSTVRKQTKAVLAKTDTNRQAELVSLIARLPKTR